MQNIVDLTVCEIAYTDDDIFPFHNNEFTMEHARTLNLGEFKTMMRPRESAVEQDKSGNNNF